MSEPTTSTDVTTITGNVTSIQGSIDNFAEGEVHYTGPMDSFSDRVALLNKIGATDKLSDFISKHAGDVFNLENVAVQRVKMTDDVTGETTAAPMIFLIGSDSNGNALTLSSVSKGIFNSVRQIVSILGDPNSWPQPLPVKPMSLETNKGRVFTLVPQV